MKRIQILVGLHDNEYAWHIRVGENNIGRLHSTQQVIVTHAFTKEQSVEFLTSAKADNMLDFAKKELKILFSEILDSIDGMEMLK